MDLILHIVDCGFHKGVYGVDCLRVPPQGYHHFPYEWDGIDAEFPPGN